MRKGNNSTIEVKGHAIAVRAEDTGDYISLTDIARSKNPDQSDDLIRNWLRNRNTLEFLGTWEILNNPGFKPVEFDGFRMQAGLNSFALTPKQWIERTGAIGIVSRRGRYGGTFAHSDIAFEFATWISVEFKLYLIKDFQRLKDEERQRLAEGWDVKRTLSKINYRIHTDAIKSYLIPDSIDSKQASITYASEADLLNLALFGMTAKEWREKNPQTDGNIRDHATVEQLVVLSNLENLNAEFIREGLPPNERLLKLNDVAIRHMSALVNRSSTLKELQG